MTAAQIFIDGQAGTTGLEIHARLSARDDITLLNISEAQRKDAGARRELLDAADIAILCLPDDAAREAVDLAPPSTRILDASTAFRTDPQWCYGLPELSATARADIAAATHVSNPGCYPQGFILLVRPLIDAGWLSPEQPLSYSAVSGYSGGGRQMIEQHQAFTSDEADARNSQAYGLNQAHKHLPEMQRYSGCAAAPIFMPVVANYHQGMLSQIPIHTCAISDRTGAQVAELLAERYADEPFIDVAEFGASEQLDGNYLNPTACNGTNNIELMVFGSETALVLCARYDNLGKGASGAAVQNLNIMLGAPEDRGLRA